MSLTASTMARAAICCTNGRRWPRLELSSISKGNENERQPSGDSQAFPSRPTEKHHSHYT